MWESVHVGGVVGRRLRNSASRGCLNHALGDAPAPHLLRADGNCSTPTDWFWPPAWEHGDDCSLMQYCGYPSSAAGPTGWAHNVCVYNEQCVSAEATAVAARSCDGSPAQRFAFKLS